MIEFLFAADLETELHENEDPGFGVHSASVLKEMVKEARCQGKYSNMLPPTFILFNGDTDSRFEEVHARLWEQMEQLPCPCYHVFGNHECTYFDDGNAWAEFFGYENTYYSWEYSHNGITTTFVVLDIWCESRDSNLKCRHPGSKGQVFRDEQKKWLKEVLERAPGLVIVFAHTHMWCPPGSRNQDNGTVDELIDILKGTYETGVVHRKADVFFSGGHHDYPHCDKVDGVYFIDPIAAIHKAYARVRIDPVNRKMDYWGRFDERSYLYLNLTGLNLQ